MSLLKEFKAFAVQGNAVDMAIGIIVGAAFGKVVTSFVEDIIMPPLGILIGGVNFTDLVITLKEASEGTAAVTLNYGKCIQTVFNFLIVAFAIFIVVKAINVMRKKEGLAATPMSSSPEENLLIEIRDLLRTK